MYFCARFEVIPKITRVKVSDIGMLSNVPFLGVVSKKFLFRLSENCLDMVFKLCNTSLLC